MKIAYLSTFYPFRGGIAQFNANLYKEFIALGHDVTAYTFTRQYPGILFPGKTQYITYNDRAVYVDSTAILDTANPLTYNKAAKKIMEDGADVVIMKYWMSYFAPSLGSVAKFLNKNGIPAITILDNVIPHEPKFFDRPLSKWFLGKNKACVAMSKSVMSDMKELAPDIPCILQPHPLYNHFGKKTDASVAKEKLKLSPEKKTLLFFGLIRDYKGLDLLIEALNDLDDSYQLVIAGESYGSFDKYDQIINTISHPERIHVFNKYISDEDVPAFFSAADVCILPYRTATQSGITAISYNFDVPVIATPAGGLEETVGGVGTGLITKDISSKSVAEAITQFYASDRNIYVENIHKLKEKLSWENFAKAVLSLV